MKGLLSLGIFTALLLVGCTKDEPEPSKEDSSPSTNNTTPTDPQPSDPPSNDPSQKPSARPEVPLKAMSLEEFHDWWKIDLSVKDQPLESVLQQLIQEIPDWSPKLVVSDEKSTDGGPVLDRLVSLDLTGVSVLEAIERACLSAGVYPRHDVDLFNGKETIELYPAPRIPEGVDGENSPQDSEWVRFVGPFALQFQELQQTPPYGTGHFAIEVAWPKLPPAIAELTNQRPFEILSVTSSGQHLMGDIAGISIAIPQEPTGLERGIMGRELHHLLRGVPSIEEIRGHITLKIPTSVKVVWFDRIEANSMMEDGPTKVTLNSVSQHFGKETHIRYSVQQSEPLYGLRAYAFNSEGELLDTPGISSSSSSWSEKGRGNGSFSYEGDGALLAVVLITGLEEYEQEFVFQNIPLSKSNEQPEQLTELDFAGHETPLSLEVLSTKEEEVFHKVRYRAKNHSNKDIREVEVVMNYLNSEKQKLDDHRTTLREEDLFSKEPMLKAGEEKELEATAFFFPKNATQTTIEVKSIQFADGTTWKPEGSEE